MTSTQQRAELQNQIWKIANEVEILKEYKEALLQQLFPLKEIQI
jgi:hypothetical protein